MAYERPKLEVVEEYDEDDIFYAPKLPWMTIIACVLVTIGTTLSNPGT
jgi:hypothetical protein